MFDGDFMRKGVTSEVFVFISALILMALILVFGIKSIKDLKNTSDNAELGLFVKNLKNEIEVFYNNDVGSSKKIKLVIPKEVEKVCIFTKEYPATKNENELDDILKYTNNNLFFIPVENFKINKITIPYLRNDKDENPLCIETKGVFNGVIEVKADNENVFVEMRREI